MQLDGKVALITGATRGIGRGIAEAYLREGAKVVVNGRNKEKGEQALQEMGAGDQAAFLPGDVMNQDETYAIVDGTVERFGRIDILVNNAGGSFDNANVVDASPETFESVLRWNVMSTFCATKRALQHMIPQQFGRIINMSSVEGKHGKPGISAYVTSKHAINGFTKSVAKEVAQYNITCNALCPGLIITDIFLAEGPSAAEAMGITLDQLIEIFTAESAIKRTNTVEEVAAVAVLLATDVAAGITGAVYSVDGGTAAY
jgi:NAD(P)-dependent dehydrogenase (short-subunit alcohol dehydrogenase family)